MANGLSFDEGRTIQASSCDACGTDHKIVKQFVLDNGNAHAVLFVALHGHGANEAWIDAIFGSFDGEYADHLTFGCRVGPVDGQAEPAATLVEAAIPYSDAPIFGEKLSRDQALTHPWLSAFWRVVDFVLVHDQDVHSHVYGGERKGDA